MQSALLEVMAEQQVSIGGETHQVPQPFLVMATQNPIEQEGVYPLPEAQRDRFLMKIHVGYPTDAEEREIVYRMGVSPPEPATIFSPSDLIALQRKADDVFVHNALVDYAVRLVLATRTPADYGMPDVAQLIQYGASPRASLGIVRATRALALLRGRDYALPQDVQHIAAGHPAAPAGALATTRSPTTSRPIRSSTGCSARCRCRPWRPGRTPRRPAHQRAGRPPRSRQPLAKAPRVTALPRRSRKNGPAKGTKYPPFVLDQREAGEE